MPKRRYKSRFRKSLSKAAPGAPPSELARKLKSCMRRGNLRIADLARWLERPDATVRGWVYRNLDPAGTEADIQHLHWWIGQLEKTIRRKVDLPIPVGLRQRERKTLIPAILMGIVNNG